jgi:hypothetical protein
MQDRKVGPNTLLVQRAALKFLYVAILKQKCASSDIILRNMRTVCFFASFVAFSHASYCLDLTVKIKSGRVRGTGVEITSFKGIAYAAAPVGPLRWRAPLHRMPGKTSEMQHSSDRNVHSLNPLVQSTRIAST